ncbi:MAG: CIA30 family protein [Elusimicrobia bacterium]|nr:CIA30 family protein [Elusimicrobiota bacterium]
MNRKIAVGWIALLLTVECAAAEQKMTEKSGSAIPVTKLVIKETILDGFEANDWLPANSDAATIKTGVVPGVGKVGKALQMDYDLKNNTQWVSLIKDIPVSDYEGKAVRFYLKTLAEKTNNLEIKLVDEDGTNFGMKLPLKSSDTWEMVTIDLTDFSYWWGGDKKLGPITQIGFAISAGEGGTGTVILDDLKLVSSWRKLQDKVKAGVIDACDSLDGWKAEMDSGATAKLVQSPGVEKQAAGMEYNFGSGKWVQMHKGYNVDLTDKSVFTFFLKWTGEENNFEFKIVDRDNTNYGKKFRLSRGNEWQQIKIPFSELTYWWGGDDKEFDMKNLKSVWLAVSVPKGGEGSILIDTFSLETLP